MAVGSYSRFLAGVAALFAVLGVAGLVAAVAGGESASRASESVVASAGIGVVCATVFKWMRFLMRGRRRTTDTPTGSRFLGWGELLIRSWFRFAVLGMAVLLFVVIGGFMDVAALAFGCTLVSLVAVFFEQRFRMRGALYFRADARRPIWPTTFYVA